MVSVAASICETSSEAVGGASIETNRDSTIDPTIDSAIDSAIDTIFDSTIDPTIEGVVEGVVERIVERIVDSTIAALSDSTIAAINDSATEFVSDTSSKLVGTAVSAIVCETLGQDCNDAADWIHFGVVGGGSGWGLVRWNSRWSRSQTSHADSYWNRMSEGWPYGVSYWGCAVSSTGKPTCCIHLSALPLFTTPSRSL